MPLRIDFPDVKALPSRRLFVLAMVAVLLVAADALPASLLGDPDRIQFALSLIIGALAIGIALRDRMTRAQATRARNRVLLLLVVLALSLTAAEFATRFVFRDVTTSTDNSSFFTRRWLRSGPSRTNAQGYRGPAFSVTKPAGVYRIAVVGDSFTYGNGVAQQDRYTDLLQARLPTNIEVLNFGTPGDNTPEHEKKVAELLGTIHPDFLLLQWYVNDMEDDDMTGRPQFRPLLPAFHQWLDASSALYAIANLKWGELQVRWGWTRSYVAFIKDRLADPHSQYSQQDSQFLHRLIDHARQAGVPMGMVLFPDTASPITDAYPFGFLHDRVLATCDEYAMTCVDLRQDFAKVKDHRELWASRFDHHPSARANAIAAERILNTFAAKWASSPK